MDFGGGAEQVALNLHRGFRAAGDEATLAVGFRRSQEAGVVEIPNLAARGLPGLVERLALAGIGLLPPRAADLVRPAALAAQPARLLRILRGREDFDMPATRSLLELAGAPDVLHCHNLHGGYFDLRELSALSLRVPMFLTLHDMWPLTGHCAYSLGCERWRSGCGGCPDLTIYPPIRRDATQENLAAKRDIYRRSTLRVACPSQWLLDKARVSALAEGTVEFRLVRNGVDLDVFNPSGRAAARNRLGLPGDALVLLFVANSGHANKFKDYGTTHDAAALIGAALPGRELVFLVLGGAETSRAPGRTRFVPFVHERSVLADYYRAADLFLHAAREDNFPNTVLESQACGTPVIATSVGGVPEQIEDGVTGALVPPGGAAEMAAAALGVLRDRAKLAAWGERAAERAQRLYDLRRQVSECRAWFAEALGGEPRDA